MRSRRLAAMTPRTRALEEELARARAEDMAEHEARAAHPLLPGIAWAAPTRHPGLDPGSSFLPKNPAATP
jgi:hypothetical protein